MAGWRNEGLAHASPLGRANRNVLQVRVVAGQPARHCNRLRVVGVHATGLRIDHQRQLVGVGALELGQAAVFEQAGRQRVVAGQFSQHFFIGARRAGRGFLLHRQAELGEQYFADLLRTAQVERLARKLESFAFQRQHALGQLLALRGQPHGVNQHAGAFDAHQDLGGRHLDALIHVQQSGLRFELRPQAAVDVQRHVAVLARILAGGVDIDLGKRDLARALAAQVFVTQALAAQVALGQAFQPVRLVGFEHVALQHGVVLIAANGDAGIREHMRVVLDVLA